MLPTYFAQYYHSYTMNGDWGWGWLMMLFWSAVIVLVIVWFVRANGHGAAPQHPEDALDIAKRRYAKGEITKEEFQQIKKDLSEK